MEDVIIVVEQSKKNKGLLIMENANKTIIVEVVNMSNIFDFRSKFS